MISYVSSYNRVKNFRYDYSRKRSKLLKEFREGLEKGITMNKKLKTMTKKIVFNNFDPDYDMCWFDSYVLNKTTGVYELEAFGEGHQTIWVVENYLKFSPIKDELLEKRNKILMQKKINTRLIEYQRKIIDKVVDLVYHKVKDMPKKDLSFIEIQSYTLWESGGDVRSKTHISGLPWSQFLGNNSKIKIYHKDGTKEFLDL